MLVSGACQTFCQGYKRLLRKSRENTPIFQVSKVPKVSQQRSCARSSSPCLSPACSPPRCLPNSEKRVAGSFFFFSLLLFFCFFSCLLFWSPPPWPVFNPTPWFLFLFHLTDERTCFLFLQKKEKEREELQKGEHKMITSQKRFFPARLLLFISIPFKIKSKFRLQLVVSTKRRNSHLI